MKPTTTDTIIGLFAGIEVAFIVLAHQLAEQTGTDPADTSRRLRETAESLPAAARNRELMAMVLHQLAAGIEGSARATLEQVIRQIVH